MYGYKMVEKLEKSGFGAIMEIVENPGLGFEYLVRILDNLNDEGKEAILSTLILLEIVGKGKTFVDLVEDAENLGYIRESQGSVALIFDNII